MKWIQVHGAYDDLHPVEALDIMYSLIRDAPDVRDIQKVKDAIRKSYDLYHLARETGMPVSALPVVSRGKGIGILME